MVLEVTFGKEGVVLTGRGSKEGFWGASNYLILDLGESYIPMFTVSS